MEEGREGGRAWRKGGREGEDLLPPSLHPSPSLPLSLYWLKRLVICDWFKTYPN